jgi:hypothetical protein
MAPATDPWPAPDPSHDRPPPDPGHDSTLPRGGSPTVLQEVPALARVLGQVVAPATLVTALLVFFGWSRTTALFGWFGIDPTSLGFSTIDYLLVSQDGLFVPGVVIALLVLLVMWLLAVVRRGRGGLLRRPWAAPALAGAGALLALNGILGVFGRGVLVDRLLVAPLSLVTGVALVSIGAHAYRSRRLTYSRGAGIAELTALAVVMSMGLFWAAGDYSAAVGRQRAAELAQSLPVAPRVVLHSARSLGIAPVSGVDVLRCQPGEDVAYAYRYAGLVLLLNSNGQYVLLPVGWTRADGSAIAVPKTDGVRIDYRTAGATDALPSTC